MCCDCLQDPALREYARRHLTAPKCDFCGAIADSQIACRASAIAKRIETGLRAGWSAHSEALPWHEGSDWPSEIRTFDEVLAAEHQAELGSAAFSTFVSQTFSDRLWTPRNAGLSKEESLEFSWTLFKDTVKYGTRFFFFDGGHVTVRSEDPLRRGAAMLNEFGRLINAFDLVRTMPDAQHLHRVRVHATDETPITAADLGAPPARFAAQGRMSAAGIAAFYGAADEETAICETTRHGCQLTAGVFEPSREVRVVDLDEIPPMPSLFTRDRTQLSRRPGLGFLRSFAMDVRRPIPPDEAIHIEYVPTQILGEYLRWVFRDREGRTVDGVAWASARRPSGRCVVLFVDNAHCIERREDISDDALHLILVGAHPVPTDEV